MADVDVAPLHRRIVIGILRDHAPQPCRISAFGSRVRGRARRLSDRDLAVDAGKPLTLREEALLSDAFDESALPWRVDAIDLVGCSPPFRRDVESHAVPFLTIGAAEPAAS